jgi:hypothetical protein
VPRKKKKGLCQVKTVPAGDRRTIRFGDLNDPRLRGRVNPSLTIEKGVVGAKY